MKLEPVPVLLGLGYLCVMTAAFAVSFKLGLFAAGVTCLITAWTLIRAGRF